MKTIILLSITLLFAGTTVFAQEQLEVSISDLLLNRGIANVTVYIESRSEGFSNSAISDESGKVLFSNLSGKGRYRIFTKTSKQYAETEITSIALKTGVLNKVLLALPSIRESVLDEVVVNDKRAVQLNTRDAQVSYLVTKKELQALPIEGRDITRSLYRLPNVTIATLGYAEAPNVSINGLNGTYTNYLIDGMDNNERFLGNVKFNVPIGFAEGISVLTNNYSVEYGNTSNGVINVTSRSGKNEMSGEAYYLTRPGSVIDSKSKFASLDLSGNQVKDGFQRHQFGVALGGALKKDKTFFYVDIEQTLDKKDNLLNVPSLNVNETVTGHNSFTYVSGKIDQFWNTNFKSSLRVNVGSFDIERQGGGLEGGIIFPSAGAGQKNRTYLIALKNSYLIGERLTAETNYQHSFFRWNYREPDHPESPSVTVQDPSGAAIATIGQTGAIFDDFEYTHQLQQKFLYRAGKHNLKAGAEFITSSYSLLGGGNAYGTYVVRLTQPQLDALKAKNLGSALDVKDLPSDVRVITYDVELRPTSFGARQNVFSMYLEDNFLVNNKLNLNFGLRFDYDNLSKGGGTKGDWNNIAPRLSFNYQLGDRSVIRGGYGIFYDKIKYSVYGDNLQFSSTSVDYKKELAELQRLGLLNPNADLDRITFPGNIRATTTGVTYLNGPTSADLQFRRDKQFTNNLRIMNPDGFPNPYSHQVSFGYQTKPTENTIFSVDLNYVATNNLYVIRNLNPAAPYPLDNPNDVKVRTVAQADATRPIPIRTGNIAVLGKDTLRGIARNVYMTDHIGKARYYAANFVFQKLRTTDKFGYRLSYSLALVESNTGSINTRAQDSNNFAAEYTYDEQDRRHVMNAFVFWYPCKNLVITPAFLLQSGQPYTILADAKVYGTTDLNGDSEAFWPADFSPGEKRHGHRLPWAKSFDISIKYNPKITNKGHMEFSADVYNLLNAENLSGFGVTRGNSNQIQNGTTFVKKASGPPRQFQFGVRYWW